MAPSVPEQSSDLDYLSNTIAEPLAEALAECTLQRPQNAISFISKYLRTVVEKRRQAIAFSDELAFLSATHAQETALREERRRIAEENDRQLHTQRSVGSYVSSRLPEISWWNPDEWSELVDSIRTAFRVPSAYLAAVHESESPVIHFPVYSGLNSESMRFASLNSDQGILWRVLHAPVEETVETNPDEPAVTVRVEAQALFVPEVMDEPSLVFFDAPRLGSFIVAPVIYESALHVPALDTARQLVAAQTESRQNLLYRSGLRQNNLARLQLEREALIEERTSSLASVFDGFNSFLCQLFASVLPADVAERLANDAEVEVSNVSSVLGEYVTAFLNSVIPSPTSNTSTVNEWVLAGSNPASQLLHLQGDISLFMSQQLGADVMHQQYSRELHEQAEAAEEADESTVELINNFDALRQQANEAQVQLLEALSLDPNQQLQDAEAESEPLPVPATDEDILAALPRRFVRMALCIDSLGSHEYLTEQDRTELEQLARSVASRARQQEDAAVLEEARASLSRSLHVNRERVFETFESAGLTEGVQRFNQIRQQCEEQHAQVTAQQRQWKEMQQQVEREARQILNKEQGEEEENVDEEEFDENKETVADIENTNKEVEEVEESEFNATNQKISLRSRDNNTNNDDVIQFSANSHEYFEGVRKAEHADKDRKWMDRVRKEFDKQQKENVGEASGFHAAALSAFKEAKETYLNEQKRLKEESKERQAKLREKKRLLLKKKNADNNNNNNNNSQGDEDEDNNNDENNNNNTNNTNNTNANEEQAEAAEENVVNATEERVEQPQENEVENDEGNNETSVDVNEESEEEFDEEELDLIDLDAEEEEEEKGEEEEEEEDEEDNQKLEKAPGDDLGYPEIISNFDGFVTSQNLPPVPALEATFDEEEADIEKRVLSNLDTPEETNAIKKLSNFSLAQATFLTFSRDVEKLSKIRISSACIDETLVLYFLFLLANPPVAFRASINKVIEDIEEFEEAQKKKVEQQLGYVAPAPIDLSLSSTEACKARYDEAQKFVRIASVIKSEIESNTIDVSDDVKKGDADEEAGSSAVTVNSEIVRRSYLFLCDNFSKLFDQQGNINSVHCRLMLTSDVVAAGSRLAITGVRLFASNRLLNLTSLTERLNGVLSLVEADQFASSGLHALVQLLIAGIEARDAEVTARVTDKVNRLNDYQQLVESFNQQDEEYAQETRNIIADAKANLSSRIADILAQHEDVSLDVLSKQIQSETSKSKKSLLIKEYNELKEARLIEEATLKLASSSQVLKKPLGPPATPPYFARCDDCDFRLNQNE